MKKTFFIGLAGILLFAACGESAEEKAKREQAIADSIRVVDSIKSIETKYKEFLSIADDKYKNAQRTGELSALRDAKSAYKSIEKYIINDTYQEDLDKKLSEINTAIENHPDAIREKLKEKEEKNPLDYLTVTNIDADLKLKSLIKGAVMVKGKIKNTASVATFKDIKYELIFYSKTDAVIKTKNETLYEYIGPNSSKSFSKEVKISDILDKQVERADIVIKDATPVED